MFKEQWKQELWESFVRNVQQQRRFQAAKDFNDDLTGYQKDLNEANMEFFNLIESLPSEFKE